MHKKGLLSSGIQYYRVIFILPFGKIKSSKERRKARKYIITYNRILIQYFNGV